MISSSNVEILSMESKEKRGCDWDRWTKVRTNAEILRPISSGTVRLKFCSNFGNYQDFTFGTHLSTTTKQPTVRTYLVNTTVTATLTTTTNDERLKDAKKSQ